MNNQGSFTGKWSSSIPGHSVDMMMSVFGVGSSGIGMRRTVVLRA